MSQGEMVGVYRLEELLGEGGMGRVYRAYDQRLDRRVALKQVLPDAQRPERRRRLRREARTLARLSHPSIVPVFDLVERDDGDWIVMELVEGPSLDQLLARGALALGKVVRFGRQVAEGLAEAHAKGVLHRDLKTENVRVSGSGIARILDFGLAKPVASRTAEDASLSATGQILGTVRAMSPEQARGHALDARSDLFSLGILLYEMATGASPFEAPSRVETLLKICAEPHQPAAARKAGLPRALSLLIDRLLEKAPEQRPASGAEVEACLRRIEDDLGEDETTPDPRGPLELAPAAIEPTDLPAPAADTHPPVAQTSFASVGRTSFVVLGLAGLMLVASWHFWLRPTAPPADPPADPFVLQQEGWQLLERFDKKGQLDRALQLFTRLLALDPQSASGHAGLARACWRKYHNDGKDPQFLERSLHEARRAVALEERLASAQVSLGLALLSSGELEAAAEAFGRARRLDPSSGEPWLGLGQTRSLQGDVKAAEQAFLEGVRRSPDDFELHDALGQLYYSGGRFADAEAAFRRGVELAGDRVLGYRNLAAALHARGEVAEAARQLQLALAIQPEPSTYANLGTLYYFQGLYGEAAAAFERALEVWGGAHHYALWANLADAYRQLPDRAAKAREAYDVAIRLVRQELERMPESPAFQSRLALYLARRGDAEAKVRELLEGLLTSLDGKTVDDPWIAHRMALAFELTGRRGEALDWLEQALVLGLPELEMTAEPDFLDLRADPRYQRLLVSLPEKPAPGERPGSGS